MQMMQEFALTASGSTSERTDRRTQAAGGESATGTALPLLMYTFLKRCALRVAVLAVFFTSGVEVGEVVANICQYALRVAVLAV